MNVLLTAVFGAISRSLPVCRNLFVRDLPAARKVWEEISQFENMNIGDLNMYGKTPQYRPLSGIIKTYGHMLNQMLMDNHSFLSSKRSTRSDKRPESFSLVHSLLCRYSITRYLDATAKKGCQDFRRVPNNSY